MTDVPSNLTPPSKVHPLVSSIPAHLKDPASYEKVQKLLFESLASTHSHGEIMEWAACPGCQRRFQERGEVLKKLGFSHPAQYMVWKQVHEIMRGNYEKDPLPKYND